MVNVGRPSRGCHRCRKRRVKCDERKPACSRCTSRNEECPGYREQSSVLFQNQTDWAIEKVKKRVLKSAAVATRIPKAPPTELSDIAIHHFFNEYISTSGVMPFLGFLPHMYGSPDAGTCFRLALPAVALASASKQMRNRNLLMEAHKGYGQALTSLNRALKDPELSKSDGVLATVFLLGLFEMITMEKLPTGSWDAHYYGRMELLKLRGKRQLETAVGRSLFIIMHNGLLINSFIGRLPPSDLFLSWFMDEQEWNEVLHFGVTVYRVARFYSKVSSIISKIQSALVHEKGGLMTDYREELIHLIGEGIALDDHLERSLDVLLTGWLGAIPCDNVFENPWSREASTQSVIDVCLEQDNESLTSIAKLINSTVRIHLLGSLKQAASLIDPDPPSLDIKDLKSRWTERCREMADGIWASVPTIIGDVDPKGKPRFTSMFGRAMRVYGLMWPLSAALTTEISPERRSQIFNVLNYIGDVVGIGQATAIVKAHAEGAPGLVLQDCWNISAAAQSQ